MVELLLDLVARLEVRQPELAEIGEQVVGGGHRLPDRLVELLLGERRRLGELGRGVLNPLAPVVDGPTEVVGPGLGTRIVASAARGEHGEAAGGDENGSPHTR